MSRAFLEFRFERARRPFEPRRKRWRAETRSRRRLRSSARRQKASQRTATTHDRADRVAGSACRHDHAFAPKLFETRRQTAFRRDWDDARDLAAAFGDGDAPALL